MCKTVKREQCENADDKAPIKARNKLASYKTEILLIKI